MFTQPLSGSRMITRSSVPMYRPPSRSMQERRDERGHVDLVIVDRGPVLENIYRDDQVDVHLARRAVPA